MTDIKDIQERIAKLQHELLEESKKMFANETKAIFDQYDGLESFSWQQYTPYFNDGDACEFGVYADSWSMKINDHNPEYGDNPDWEYIDYNEQKKRAEALGVPVSTIQSYTHKTKLDLARALHELPKFVNAFDPNVLKQMFGDHREITVYRDRVEVEHYDHE